MGGLLRTGVVLVAATMGSAALAQPAVSTVPADAAACSRLNEQLYAWAEAQEKRDRKLVIPREFARVSANLDDFCTGKDFAKAQIALDWMNNCIKNYRKPYSLGFCQRNEAYFCAVMPDSDACPKK
jgi:hypothetical protein